MSLKTKAKTTSELWQKWESCLIEAKEAEWVSLDEIEKARLDNPLFDWNWHESKDKMTALELALAKYIEKWFGCDKDERT